MENCERPIAVFDSGLGGISVLKRLVEAMPNESFVYYGDSANAPYGPRTPQDVCQLTLAGMARLDIFQPKAIVIACNTATAAAQDALEKQYPHIPVIGIEPAVRQAVKDNPGGHILSLATAGTLASPRYKKQLQEITGRGNIVSIAAPGIVSYVEGGMCDHTGLIHYLRSLFAPWQAITFDGVVLGCTHFPFATPEIQEALGYAAQFYEPSRLVAQKVQSRLVKWGLSSRDTGYGSVTFISSSNEKMMLSCSWKLFSIEFK